MPVLLTTEEACNTLGISRDVLDRITKAAPVNLPGSPIQVGMGRKRRHYRYPADTLIDWFRAASQAVNAEPEPATNSPAVTVPRRSSSGEARSLRALTR